MPSSPDQDEDGPAHDQHETFTLRRYQNEQRCPEEIFKEPTVCWRQALSSTDLRAIWETGLETVTPKAWARQGQTDPGRAEIGLLDPRAGCGGRPQVRLVQAIKGC